MTPTWPQLVGWMQTAQVSTARGRWRAVEDGKEQVGTFAFRAPDEWAVVDDAGERAEGPRHLWRVRCERGDDYHRAIGEVVGVEHDGRAAWLVRLEPPARKRGLLTLVVDDRSGLVLRVANDEHGVVREVLGLALDEVLPAELFAPLLAERAEQARQQALYDLLPTAPTPLWFPWRRAWVERPDCLELETLSGLPTVGRAPLGEDPPASEFVPTEQIHRLDHGGWSWAVAAEHPIDDATARRVVEQVVELPD